MSESYRLFCLAVLSCIASGCAQDPSTNSPRNRVIVVTDTLAASVVLSIGAADGPDDRVVSRVFSGFIRHDRIFVSNGGEPEIREYDLSGSLVRRIGRRGGGPGEFRHLTWITPLAPDSLVALDGRSSRVTVFDSTGTYVRSFRLSVPEHGQAEWIAEYGSGFAVGYSRGLDPRQLSGAARDSFFVELIGRSFQAGEPMPDLLPPIGGRWWRRREVVGAVGLEAIRDGPQALIAGRKGMLVVSSSDSHSILRWNGNTWSSVVLQGQSWDNGNVADAPDIPVRLYEQLVLGPRGSLWLSDFAVESDEHRTWVVFSPDGQPQSILRLPASFRIWQVEEHHVLGKRIDEMGVEFVELWEIQ